MRILFLALSVLGVQAVAAEYVPTCRVAVFESGAVIDYTYAVTKDDLSGAPLPMKLGFRSNREEAAQPYLTMSANSSAFRPGLNFTSTIRSSRDEQGTATMQLLFSRYDFAKSTDLHVRLQRANGQKVWTATYTEVDAQKHVVLANLRDISLAEDKGVLNIPYAGTVNTAWSCRVP